MGYEFFGEKIIFPSTPVPGINNDQSITTFLKLFLFKKTKGIHSSGQFRFLMFE